MFEIPKFLEGYFSDLTAVKRTRAEHLLSHTHQLQEFIYNKQTSLTDVAELLICELAHKRRKYILNRLKGRFTKLISQMEL